MILSRISDSIADWLDRIEQGKKIPTSIVAFNVGLFQTAEGFNAYLIGSREYDPSDSDWATREDFVPKLKYLKFEGWLFRVLPWRLFQYLLKREIATYVKERPSAAFSAMKHITIGFDDGDLVSIK